MVHIFAVLMKMMILVQIFSVIECLQSQVCCWFLSACCSVPFPSNCVNLLVNGAKRGVADIDSIVKSIKVIMIDVGENVCWSHARSDQTGPKHYLSPSTGFSQLFGPTRDFMDVWGRGTGGEEPIVLFRVSVDNFIFEQSFYLPSLDLRLYSSWICNWINRFWLW